MNSEITINQFAYLMRDWLYSESKVDEFKTSHENFIADTMNRLSVLDVDPKYEKKNRDVFLYIMWRCPNIVAKLINNGKIEIPFNYIFERIIGIIENPNLLTSIPGKVYLFYYSMLKFIGQYTNSSEYYRMATDMMSKISIFSGMAITPTDCLHFFKFNENFRHVTLNDPVFKSVYINRFHLFNSSGIKISNEYCDEYYDNYRLNYSYKKFAMTNDKLDFCYLMDTVISMIRNKTQNLKNMRGLFYSFIKRRQWEKQYDSFQQIVLDNKADLSHIFGFNKFDVLFESNQIVISKMRLLHKNQNNKNEVESIILDCIKVPNESFVKYIEHMSNPVNPLFIDVNELSSIKLFMKVCSLNYIDYNDFDRFIDSAMKYNRSVCAKMLLYTMRKPLYELDTYPLEYYSPKYFTTDVGTNCSQITDGPIFLNLPGFIN